MSDRGCSRSVQLPNINTKPVIGGTYSCIRYIPAYGGFPIGWKDYAHGGKQRKMTLDASEFIRRFLLHVLPKGLVRIRYYGGMANRCRRQRARQCRELLAAQPTEALLTPPMSWGGRRWSVCGGAVEVVEVILPRPLLRCRSSQQRVPDSS